MDIDDQIELEHLLFFDRRCRACGKVKNLISDFLFDKKGSKYLSVILFL